MFFVQQRCILSEAEASKAFLVHVREFTLVYGMKTTSVSAGMVDQTFLSNLDVSIETALPGLWVGVSLVSTSHMCPRVGVLFRILSLSLSGRLVGSCLHFKLFLFSFTPGRLSQTLE